MSISREVLAKYVFKGCSFVETGTRWGTSCVRAFDCGASDIATCEIDPEMYQIATNHLADVIRTNHLVVHSDSVSFLKWKASGDIVFLDAHTDTYSPVIDELKAIATWKTKPKVILIDDLRCMDAWKVSSKDLLKAIRAIGDCQITYEDGVVEGDIMAVRYV